MNKFARLAPAAALSAAVVLSATAGSAVAAGMITGKQVKNGSITSLDVKNRSLVGKDVKPGSLTQKQLAPGVKTKLNKPNVVGYQVVTETIEVPTAGQGQVYLFCPAGKVALSGGGQWEDGVTETGAAIQESYPGKAIGEFFAPLEAGDVANAWKVGGSHNNLEAYDFTGYVVCVNPA